jgi:hypothetical protein
MTNSRRVVIVKTVGLPHTGLPGMTLVSDPPPEMDLHRHLLLRIINKLYTILRAVMRVLYVGMDCLLEGVGNDFRLKSCHFGEIGSRGFQEVIHPMTP